MLDDMRRKIVEHEKRSRASEGQRPSNPRQTVIATGPLFLTAIFLYGFSIFYSMKIKDLFLGKNPSQENDSNVRTRIDTSELRSDSEVLMDSDDRWK